VTKSGERKAVRGKKSKGEEERTANVQNRNTVGSDFVLQILQPVRVNL
jgi:hypothetical protein